MTDVGYWAIVLTFVVSVYVGVASILGRRQDNATLLESVRNGAVLGAVLVTVSAGALVYLLMTRDLSVRYVYEHVSTYLPTVYTFSAFWAGQQGSLLLWLWFTTLLTAFVALRGHAQGQSFSPLVLAVMAFTQAFLALVLAAISNPFESLAIAPQEGMGLNPLLQNFWMVAHPPVIFAAYAAYTVPFAYAISGLVTRQLGDAWLGSVRRWSLWAWLFLGMGILMGAYWAYLELGWGGYWGWDPVENSSLIPWLTGTALLHSLLMQQQRKTFRAWTLWLIALTFVLCLFATFVTRSGVIQSVHAFGRSVIGVYFAAFIVLCLGVFVALVSLRRGQLTNSQEPGQFLSREAGLLLTNLLLCGAALIVLIGTLFPAITEFVRGQQAALGASFYERTVGPLMQAVIVLLGFCPWLAWGGITPDRLRRDLLPPAVVAAATLVLLLVFGVTQTLALIAFVLCAFVISSLLMILARDLARLRNTNKNPWQAVVRLVGRSRRRYGAHLVHLGIVLMAIGVTGSSFYQDEVQVALVPGEEIDVQGYTLSYREFVSHATPSKQLFQAVVDVYRGPHRLATLSPEKSLYWSVEQWVTEVAIRSTLKEDLYLILAGFEQNGLASFRVLINPLVAWLWVGSIALLLGGVAAWWPARLRGKES